MYTYYLICLHAKDPKTGKTLPIWWKSNVTKLQLIQFIIMMTVTVYTTFDGVTNTASGKICAAFFFFIASLFGLFAMFYVEVYILKPYLKPRHINKTL